MSNIGVDLTSWIESRIVNRVYYDRSGRQDDYAIYYDGKQRYR